MPWFSKQPDLKNNPLYLEPRVSAAETQLAQNSKQLEVAGVANAPYPLYIPTYDGSNQVVHPKVLKLDTAFGGWKWWMSYNPYPSGNEDYENPCLAYSADGITWYPISNNPIDQPTTEQIAAGGFMSDSHIVMVNGVMEIWYRYATNSTDVKIYRMTSTNGSAWANKQLMIDCALTGEKIVAPALIHENGLYKMWFVNQNSEFVYQESTDGLTWINRRILNIPSTINGYTCWHLDVSKTDIGYEFVCNYTKGLNGELYYFSSADNVSFTVPVKVIGFSQDDLAWDNQMIYRASLIKDSGTYRVYYSAQSKTGKWHIGLSSSKDILNLKGTYFLNYVDGDFRIQNSLFLEKVNAIAIGTARYRRDSVQLKNDTTGVRLDVIGTDEAGLRNNANSDYANFRARKVQTKFMQYDVAGNGLASSEGIAVYDNTTKVLSFHDGANSYHLNGYRRTPPTTSTSSGVRGTWAADDNYLYICKADNQWIRIVKDSTVW